MNFLAHLYLSGDNDQVKIGNFIGDFVKGDPRQQFDGDLLRGILIHREIDHFTDSHPVSQRSKKRLVSKYRHYSGVIIDIFYDHFLASNWNDYSDQRLEDFARDSYQLMKTHWEVLPEKARHMLPYMERYNWLYNYSKIEGIGQTLSGMSRRTAFKSRMDEAVKDLEENYPSFRQDFLDFFPEIRVHIRNYDRI